MRSVCERGRDEESACVRGRDEECACVRGRDEECVCVQHLYICNTVSYPLKYYKYYLNKCHLSVYSVVHTNATCLCIFCSI